MTGYDSHVLVQVGSTAAVDDLRTVDRDTCPGLGDPAQFCTTYHDGRVEGSR